MQQTPNLHTIINYACEEAGRLGNAEILPDHMMLGILRLGAGKAFAKAFGGRKLSGCPYLPTGMDGPLTAHQWERWEVGGWE